jgi:pimeloyl-ACP methyl ester carboxylesterase
MNDAKCLIVLVHGICSNRLAMWPIACLLRAQGFRVRQWPYRSLFYPIAHHAARFSEFLNAIQETESRYHIVAHSMGAIVVRSALLRCEHHNLGRLVFLAPPNRGSPIARMVSKVLGHMIPPALELSDAKNSFVNQLDSCADLEIGTIAARFDLLVPLENTHFPNQKDHVVINATHNSLLLSVTASRLTANFLNSGSFSA